MPQTIVAATVDAVILADSPIITVPSAAHATTVLVSGLAGAESIALYINTVGSTYEVLRDTSGNAVVLALAATNAWTLTAPGNYKIVKGITAGVTSIATSSPSQV